MMHLHPKLMFDIDLLITRKVKSGRLTIKITLKRIITSPYLRFKKKELRER